MITTLVFSRAATLLAKTLRVEYRGVKIPERAVIMFWHGKMFGGWWAVRSNRPIAMVSKSKDGDYLGIVLEHWGYALARGSSSRDGLRALEESIEQVRRGDANRIVITPDGPRGPRHSFKRGAFHAAHELSLPLIMLKIECSRAIKLKSWDEFEVPYPFAKLIIHADRIDLDNFPTIPREQYEWIAEHTHVYEEFQPEVPA